MHAMSEDRSGYFDKNHNNPYSPMPTFLEKIMEIVPRALPNIPESIHSAIIDRIVNAGGFTSTQELKYVKEDDFADLLPLVRRRQLLEVFQIESKVITVNLEIVPSSTTEVSNNCLSIISPSRSEDSPSASQPYPESFADQRDNGQLLDGGYASLLIQVKNRIENLNRASSFHQHRSASHGQKRGPTDTYGCTRFQPSLPAEETEDTMETKRQQLEETYSQDGTAGAERPQVKKLMDSTFYLQRSHINVVPTPTIATLKAKWPYLFSHKGLYSHFELLTDIPVLRSLDLAMEECGKVIVEMFKTKPTNARMKEVLCQLDDDVELSYQVIHLLLSHFSEDVSGLIVLADGYATAADLESSLSLPATPRLILLGETGSRFQRWMLSIEGQIVCKGIQSTFVTGLASFFSCFYIFNLQYQEEAACTLEFIQRRFVGINPEKGTKAAKGKKRRTVNSHVASLLRRLMDFQWDFI
ncbi:uncharacterized protein LOC114555050 [Perca flavescens]|uniref:uncharacterized protein LOC114555050 n=1 Tax=Perca flavescens TaxID=8167 RepID=UPI00106EBA56|nr:uncharacterized protein LOC114555050 [Perca flavescens]